MNKSEKKVLVIIVLIIVVCIAGVTAVAFLHRPADNNRVSETNVSVNTTGAAEPSAPSNQVDGAATTDQTTSASGNQSATTEASTSGNNTQISLEEAKAIALDDSNMDESSVTFRKQKLERERNGYEYEIEFHDGVTEYDYEINAQTGEIISKSFEPYDFD